jgi:hypothetical protein
MDNLLKKFSELNLNPEKRGNYIYFKVKRELTDDEVGKIKNIIPNNFEIENFYDWDDDKYDYPRIKTQVKESDKKKIEEAVIKYFEAKTKKYNDNPALKGKQKTTLPDELQAAIIKNKGGKVEESDILFTNDFAKQNQINYIDDEGRMAKQQLFKIKKYAQELCDMLEDNTQLEGWVQAKITKAEEAIGSVKHYMEYEMFRKKQG